MVTPVCYEEDRIDFATPVGPYYFPPVFVRISEVVIFVASTWPRLNLDYPFAFRLLYLLVPPFHAYESLTFFNVFTDSSPLAKEVYFTF